MEIAVAGEIAVPKLQVVWMSEDPLDDYLSNDSLGRRITPIQSEVFPLTFRNDVQQIPIA